MRLWELFVLPLQQYGFMRYGVAVAAIVGVTSAVLSCLLVVRRWALMGDAIAHAVLLGVAVGWLAARHVGIFWGALAAGILTGLAITFVERNSRVKLDAAMGILFTFAFALGLAIISVTRPRGIDLFHVLLGNVLGVGRSDLLLTAASGGLVLIVVAALFKEFHLWTFDPVMAQAVGMPVRGLHYLFTALLSATIVAALQAVGLVLVIAMLITPGATAYLLADRLRVMMVIAAGVGLFSAVGGLYTSFYVDVASGPAMVIVVSLAFAATFFFAPKRGLVSTAIRRRRSARRVVDEDILKAVYAAERDRGTSSAEGIADRTGHPLGEISERLPRLARRGLIAAHPEGVQPSDEGRQEAVRLIRTHRLIERYLSDAERVHIADLHREADRLEHTVGPEELEELDRALGRPRLDPHGHPIPTPGGELVTIAGRPLTDIPVGTPSSIIMVRDDREDLLREMADMGILPQETITVLGTDGGRWRVSIGGRDAELGSEIAERVFVASGGAVT